MSITGVIVTGMNMPDKCASCDLYKKKQCCEVTNTWNATSGINRLHDCPMKSVEGLLKYIQDHSYPVRYDSNSIEQGMTITGIEQAIKEYLWLTEEEINERLQKNNVS